MFPGFTKDRPMGSRKKPESAFKRLGFSESEDDSTSEHEPFDLEPTVPDYLQDNASTTSAKKKLAGFKSLQTLFQGANGADDEDEDEDEEQEEHGDGEDAQEKGEEFGEKHDGNLDFDVSRRSDMSVASPAPVVAQHSTSETSRLIEQFMQPAKSQKRVNKHAQKAPTSSRSKPVPKGRRELSPHQTLLSTAISSRVKSPFNIMEISISSPSLNLPQRTKPLTGKASQKRATPADNEEAERSTKTLKASHSQKNARRKTALQTTSHSTKSIVKPRPQSAASTPSLFTSLAKKKIDHSRMTSKSEGAPSPASRPQLQSSISSFCIEITIPRSPLQPLADNKSQESQKSSKISGKSDTLAKSKKTEKPQKKRPSQKLQKVREKHPHDGLPYHGPTNDFKVLVSPRRLPQHNGSSEFFVVDDDEKDIQAARYPKSREIDRKTAAIEREKWALAFAPPCVTGDEVT
ncbi:hypothetical protein KEM56_007055 [Ascosphaera pollenicola]|nr:hypothetical protein KEM56_007055 [Ascosphaera pollenicola]